MKIVVPEPHVDLYEQGFGQDDPFSRAEVGKQLSELVERIDDPVVIALDGSWGSGKSYFLKRWVGAHTLENEGTATTVYFDSFAHDYLDDPLIAITAIIGERVEAKTTSTIAMKKIKSAVVKIFPIVARVGLAAATAGTSEVVGAAASAGLSASGKEFEKASEAFWKKEDGKREAMVEFTDALIELTKPANGQDEAQKLVIVIDEFDRCRPDYALSLLEVIKHFFAVPNVHFVLGVNLGELQNSVKIRYGNGVNARLYLQKFITLSMQLPERSKGWNGELNQLDYFVKTAKNMQLDESLVNEVNDYLGYVLPNEMLSFRGMQRLLTDIALVPQVPTKSGNLFPGYLSLISGLVVMKTAFPETFRKALKNEITMQDVRMCFRLDLKKDQDSNNNHEYIHFIWASFVEPSTISEKDRIRGRGQFGNYGLDSPERAFQRIINDYFGQVKLGNF